VRIDNQVDPPGGWLGPERPSRGTSSPAARGCRPGPPQRRDQERSPLRPQHRGASPLLEHTRRCAAAGRPSATPAITRTW